VRAPARSHHGVGKQRLIVSAAVVPALLAAGIWTGLGVAGQGSESAAGTGFIAKLNAAQEVPKPAGVRASAAGTFSATLVRNRTGGTLSWRLTFQGLTGKAVASHIHVGVRGRAGAVGVALCGPCKSGARGSARVNAKTLTALLAGRTYVNVHTAENAAGEIRGQIAKAPKATVPPPPPTTTDTGGPPPPPPTYEDTYR
jgi:hypothetical protein